MGGAPAAGRDEAVEQHQATVGTGADVPNDPGLAQEVPNEAEPQRGVDGGPRNHAHQVDAPRWPPM